ncbi:hypothetical protein U0070_023482 [Myodes glareolus]|uniref:G-protein coupled receptors family 1 profile domain-containing protein n=1 Tax=Myodes glareolus TaxID=447135 RepID=A0AAW0H705_MYOGA
MKVVVEYILLIILGVEIVIGSLGNGFIILVNIMDWDKRRKISTVDKIFTALAISRLAFMWSLVIILLIYDLYPSLVISEKILRISNFFWTVVNHFSIWLATCLSLFYFLKIASFSNSIFLFLKWRAEKVVSMTLLVSLLFLFINLIVINAYIVIWFDGYKANMSYSSDSNEYGHFTRFLTPTNTMFTFIPFIVSLTTLFLLIFSLWRHLKNMQHNTKGYRDVSTTAHIKALQMVVTFLSLYTFFFLALVMQSLKNDVHFKNLFNLIFDGVALAFPSGHSCVLILGNTKLRRAFLSMMWWLRYKLNIAEPLGNGFIVLVSIKTWVKRRTISTMDQILMALAISRIALLWSILTTVLIYVKIQAPIITKKLIRIIDIHLSISNHFSIWLATCLSIFYFLKIANYSNFIFLYLKWRVKKVVSVTLIASLLLLFLNILAINRCIDVWIDGHEANISYSVISSKSTQVFRLILITTAMFTLMPFTVCLITFLLLIFSLWRHLKNIHYNAKGSRDVSTRAHIKTLQTVVTFLLLYTSYFLSVLLQFCKADLQKESPIVLFLLGIGMAFPSVHSWILILSNTHLRQACFSVLWWLRSHYSASKSGVHHRKLRKYIDGTGEHCGLGQEKKDLFRGSDPYCSGHLQN